jgi:hypothetical protein
MVLGGFANLATPGTMGFWFRPLMLGALGKVIGWVAVSGK